MIKSYLKTAWRSLVSHKAYAAITIFGLAIGIGSSLVNLFDCAIRFQF